MTNRNTLKTLTDADCIKAYKLNREQGEGCSMISGVLQCSYQTADAAINKGERLINDQAAAVAQITKSFEDRIAGLKTAIEADQGGYVFCWDKYSLGVSIQNGKPVTVGVEDATITTATDSRSFLNGSNERAVLMPRVDALRCAVVSVSKSLAHMNEQIAKQA
jgi:hypothetical protein